MPTLRLGTRSSPLALAQSRWVAAELARIHDGLTVELCPIKTTGDRQHGKPLAEIGGKGLFTAEIEDALQAGRVDLAVHSLKDLPVQLPPGLALGAVPKRVSPADVLVTRDGTSLRLLPPGATIGTSSPRRMLCLRVSSPHLKFAEIRGNVDTRLRKLEAREVDALLMAHAGLLRLGLTEGRHIEVLPLLTLVPAPGQGALAIEVRGDDAQTRALLEPLHDPATSVETTVERGLLEALGGGCRMALGALASARDGRVRLTATLASEDGRRLFRAVREAAMDRAHEIVRDTAEDLRRQQGAEAGAACPAR